MKFVIRAGGIGTRLWPYSRASKPKQFHDLGGQGKTMLQDAVGRIASIASAADVFVSTGVAHEALVREQLPDLPADQLVVEPALRNTGPAVGMECALLEACFPGCTIASLGADHHIGNPAEFCRLLSAAEEAANVHPDYLFTIGVKPTRPETGYGYIHKGSVLCHAAGEAVYEASEFLEKPAADVAECYVATGDYLWNSNMFVWKARTVLDLYAEFQPAMHATLTKIAAAARTATEREVIEAEYPTMESIAVDHAILESAPKVATLDGNFDWGDIGSWAALTSVIAADTDGNLLNGEVLHLDTTGVTAYSQTERLIALVGVEDLIVVDTKDALLVCRTDQAQRAREIVERLQRDPRLERYS